MSSYFFLLNFFLLFYNSHLIFHLLSFFPFFRTFSNLFLESSSMLFAPSTIAIAALILSFSILLMDCTLWLNTIPNFCLPLHEENPSESSNKNFRDSNHSNVQKSKYLESYYRLDMNNNSKECS